MTNKKESNLIFQVVGDLFSSNFVDKKHSPTMSKVRIYLIRPIATHKQKLNHSSHQIPIFFFMHSCLFSTTLNIYSYINAPLVCVCVRHAAIGGYSLWIQVGTRQICFFSFSGRKTDLIHFRFFFPSLNQL